MEAFAPCLSLTVRPLAARHSCGRRPLTSRSSRQSRRLHPHACTEARTAEDMLRSEDYVERIRGINRAAEITSLPDRLDLLLPLAQSDRASQVRFCALSHLASLSPSVLDDTARARTLDCARVVLRDDTDTSCRSGAADVIAGLRLIDGFEDLVKAYKGTTDWMLRFSIVAGMGEMAHVKAFDFLKEVVLDEANQGELVLAAAIGALGDLGDPRGVGIVDGFVESDDEAVRERAAIAKKMLEKES